jgi:hypothetical protein
MIGAFGAGRPRGDREDRDDDATREVILVFLTCEEAPRFLQSAVPTP